MGDPLITPAQAAAILELTTDEVYRLAGTASFLTTVGDTAPSGTGSK
jgi:hypothetical protein